MGDITAREPIGGKKGPIIGAGNHLAICYSIVDLGTQELTFEGNSKDVHRVRIVWELPKERIEINGEDLPRAIGKEYTLSLHKKSALRQHLESWRAKVFTRAELDGFKVNNILGKSCMLNIIHDTYQNEDYAKISSISPLMKGMIPTEPENPIISFYIQNDGFDNIPEGIPDWMKDKIYKSLEYEAWTTQRPASNENDQAPVEDGDPGYNPEDDIPF